METVNAIVTIVQSVGLPGALLIGGGWFFVRRMWPDLVRLAETYAQAMIQVAKALEAVADRLPPSSAS